MDNFISGDSYYPTKKVSGGSNHFQKEYIEYLQDKNLELLNKLNHMKQIYENRILSKSINKHCLTSTFEDILNICTIIPEEIDLFFDKFSAAMAAFKNILLRKSEMVQLVEKISRTINPVENCSNDLIAEEDKVKEHILEPRIKKVEAVKVSPMINGHVIKTGPRIYLSRVPGLEKDVLGEGQSETRMLSPIIEASPDTSSDAPYLRSNIFKEIKIPLERINLNKMPYNYISEESPKSRFKGPKTWKKSLSSNRFQSDNNQVNPVFLDNNENLNKKLSCGETENIDPLEGPSWLYADTSDINSSSSCYVDFKRRKHRFATKFDTNQDTDTCFNEKPKKSLETDPNTFYESRKETDDENMDLCNMRTKISESSEDFIYESFSSEGSENNSPLDKKYHSSKGHNEQRGRINKKNKVKQRKSRLIKDALKNNVFVQLEDCTSTKEILLKVTKIESPIKKKKLKKSTSLRGSKSPAPENESRKKRKAAPSFKLVEPSLITKLRRS